MVRWTQNDMPDQTGRTVLITGANSGLGLASALALGAKGARVLMACRDPQRGAAALEKAKDIATGAEPTLVRLDLADLDAVERCAAEVAKTVNSLDILMNNAGVMALPYGCTAEGFEMQFGTNHLGHFALTGQLLPLLLAAPAARVVTTSSNAHRFGRMSWDDLNWERRRYRKWPAYGQSKLANLLFMRELDRRASEAGADLVSLAAHPGYASTHLQFAGPEQQGSRMRAAVMSLGNRLAAQPAEMGALPQLYAATSPDVASGDYFGPDGLMEMRGYPKPARSTRRSRDMDAALRLWELSEELTDVKYDF